jgi:hypothetical protein
MVERPTGGDAESGLFSHVNLLTLGRQVLTGEHKRFKHKHSRVSFSTHFLGAVNHARIESADGDEYPVVIGCSKQKIEELYDQQAREEDLFHYNIIGGDSMTEHGEVASG